MIDYVCQEIKSTDPGYASVLELRNAVLRQPLGLSLFSEDLSAEESDVTIVAVTSQNALLGCVMLSPLRDQQLKLRQMAVQPEYAGRGVGRALVTAAEQWAYQQGYTDIVMHARKTALGFYVKLGYEVEGDEFLEVTVPHFAMYKRLKED